MYGLIQLQQNTCLFEPFSKIFFSFRTPVTFSFVLLSFSLCLLSTFPFTPSSRSLCVLPPPSFASRRRWQHCLARIPHWHLNFANVRLSASSSFSSRTRGERETNKSHIAFSKRFTRMQAPSKWWKNTQHPSWLSHSLPSPSEEKKWKSKRHSTRQFSLGVPEGRRRVYVRSLRLQEEL